MFFIMWRSISTALLLFVLAKTANALPIDNFVENFNTATETVQVEKSSPLVSHYSPALIDDSDPNDSFSLPRIYRACASVFSNEIQTTPNYVLVIEFFEIKLTAGLFKNLANPPAQLNWYEQLSHKSHSNRLSGWKDGNTLYAARTTYHS
jgi:hypothetical protein